MSCWVEACLLILTVSSVSSRDSCYTLEKEVYISRTRTYESPTGRSVLLTCAAMVPLQKCEGMCESQSQPSVSLFPRFKQVSRVTMENHPPRLSPFKLGAHAHAHTHTYTTQDTRTYLHTNKQTRTHARMHKHYASFFWPISSTGKLQHQCTHAHTRTHTHTHTHTRTHTHTHTHAHAHTHSRTHTHIERPMSRGRCGCYVRTHPVHSRVVL